jgi:hypothetical protein
MPVPFIRRAGRRVFRIRGIRRGKSRRGSGGYLPERGAGCVCPDSGSFRRDFLTTITGAFSRS